ncbi:MAG: uroporphyrinogen decarboxylase family protein [Anaerolineaceae bacterium]|nr:uroporphyrinogen decarboxylase family protein [Anaerolineaceae bacterium]
MNSYQRVLARLQGQPVDRPPNFNIYMTFAADHIGQPLERYYQDYRVLVEANLVMLDDFESDIVQAISDPYREAVDFGLDVIFPENSLPINTKPLLEKPEDLSLLKIPNPYSSPRMRDRLEAVRSLREKVGGEVPIMGWVEGALAEAVDLRGMTNLMMDLIQRPEWVKVLLEMCGELSVQFSLAQLEAGADIIGLGDAAASQISPAMYRRFALPYEQKVFSEVHNAGGIGRLHICGDTNKILPDMVASGAKIIDLDWMVDMSAAVNQFGDQVSFCGNVDPVAVLLQGTPEEVYRATLANLNAGGMRSICAAGCEVPINTPHENLTAQNRALQDYGQG